MSEKMILPAQKRETKEDPNTLRRKGLLPAVVYGHGEENQNLTLTYNQFVKIYELAGSSSLIGLKIEEREPINVLIQEVQRDPVSDKIIHVDFHRVKMTEKIHAEVELLYEGEAPAVKELGGTLVKNYDKIEVECLPGDLVHEIKIDLTNLKNFHDSIQVKDLALPKGIVSLIDKEAVLATILPPKVEEEVKPEEVVPEVVGVEPEATTTAPVSEEERDKEKVDK